MVEVIAPIRMKKIVFDYEKGPNFDGVGSHNYTTLSIPNKVLLNEIQKIVEVLAGLEDLDIYPEPNSWRIYQEPRLYISSTKSNKLSDILKDITIEKRPNYTEFKQIIGSKQPVGLMKFNSTGIGEGSLLGGFEVTDLSPEKNAGILKEYLILVMCINEDSDIGNEGEFAKSIYKSLIDMGYKDENRLKDKSR